MTDVDARAIAEFGQWLHSLADDTRNVVSAIEDESLGAEVRSPLAGSLNYLFKSLDLIDDGIEGLGFLDDAFVLRIAAGHAAQAGELPDNLKPLAAQAELVSEFLGEVGAKLDAFVRGLTSGVVRGRSVEQIVSDASVREEFVGDVRGWASRFSPPQFVLDDKGLAKLRSFLSTKLG